MIYLCIVYYLSYLSLINHVLKKKKLVKHCKPYIEEISLFGVC